MNQMRGGLAAVIASLLQMFYHLINDTKWLHEGKGK